MSSDTSTLVPRMADRQRLRFLWWWLAAFLAVVLIVVAISRALANPATVGRVTFVNNTTYAMDVDVTGAARDGWMGLGTAERQDTTVLRDVIDQGNTWIFRLKSQGFDAGELRFRKNELKRSGWQVVISHSMSDRLARQGATATPPPDY